jgi:hypothetical protein
MPASNRRSSSCSNSSLRRRGGLRPFMAFLRDFRDAREPVVGSSVEACGVMPETSETGQGGKRRDTQQDGSGAAGVRVRAAELSATPGIRERAGRSARCKSGLAWRGDLAESCVVHPPRLAHAKFSLRCRNAPAECRRYPR